MNIIEAVQALVARGGRVRRTSWSWKAGAYVTANGNYYFTYHEPVHPGGPSVPRGRGTPTPEDMLATDWEWNPGDP